MNAYPILVGYDSSPSAVAALHWAQDEAARCAAPLRLVYVYEWATTVVPVPLGGGWPDATVRREAVATLDETVAAGRRAKPELMQSGTVVDGPVVPTLRKLSERARLLVLGHRGLGGFNGLLAGSVAIDVATHAHCPVVVVRGTAPLSRPVVVGVDLTAGSEHTVGFAFEQAAAREVDLVAVHAWQPPPVPRRTGTTGRPRYQQELAEAHQRLTGELMTGWLDKYPQVTVRVEVVPSHPAQALVEASAEAQLVVVGSRGRGGFRGLLLGSVARQLVQHSHSPVAVVRDFTQPVTAGHTPTA